VDTKQQDTAASGWWLAAAGEDAFMTVPCCLCWQLRSVLAGTLRTQVAGIYIADDRMCSSLFPAGCDDLSPEDITNTVVIEKQPIPHSLLLIYLNLLPVHRHSFLQGADDLSPEDITFTVVSEKQPTEQQLSDLRFAWRCVKHVKSNAITVAKDNKLLGMGSGQPNRCVVSSDMLSVLCYVCYLTT
jgi:hypothetical protein